MIWHIFRKDVAQLWQVAVLVALVHVMSSALFMVLGPFLEPRHLRSLAQILPYVAMFTTAALAVIVVQQDAVPGTSADWLIRPVRRRDLLLAKLLFVAILGHGPIMLMAFIELKFSGFATSIALEAGASAGISTLLLLSLPAMALASVTRSLTESLIGALAVLVVIGGLVLAISVVMSSTPAVSSSGVTWVRTQTIAAFVVVLSAAVFALQYGRRSTTASRRLIGIATCVYALIWTSIPWAPSFALQQAMGRSTDGPSVAVELGIDANTAHSPADSSQSADGPSQRLSLSIPVVFNAVPTGSILYLDRAEIRLLDVNGRVLHEASSRQFSKGSAQIIPESSRTDGGNTMRWQTHQQITLPSGLAGGALQPGLRLEIRYSITQMKPERLSPVAAVDGMLHEEAIRCRTRLNADGESIQLGCLAAGNPPSCLNAHLITTSGESVPATEGCAPDYSPLRLDIVPPLVKRFGVSVPVGGESGSSGQVLVTPYHADRHVQRVLQIGNFDATRFRSPTVGSVPKSSCFSHDALSAAQCAGQVKLP